MENLTKVLKKIGLNEEIQIPAFRRLLEITHCFPNSHEEFETPLIALNELINTTQAKWLRKTSLERYELEDNDILQNNRKELIAQFKQLNLLNEIKPSHKQYDYALLLGALEPRVVNRFNYLQSLWKKGIRFTQLILLGSERLLIESEEPIARELGARATEFNMINAILKTARSFWPKDLLSVSFTVINTPLHKTGKRPTTADTVKNWLLKNPKPGLILTFSNQPFVNYQNVILTNNLPVGFELDTVGSAILEGSEMESIKLSVVLDTLARLIFADRFRLEVTLKSECLQEELQ